jgi:hypothetical protein
VQGTDSGDYLFIARVCPAAGEPDLKTSPPLKRKHRHLSEEMNKNELRANSPSVRHQERKMESTMQTVVVNIYKEQFDAYMVVPVEEKMDTLATRSVWGTELAGSRLLKASKSILPKGLRRTLNSSSEYWR